MTARTLYGLELTRVDLFRIQYDRLLDRPTNGNGDDLSLAQAELSKLPVASTCLRCPVEPDRNRIEREREVGKGTTQPFARGLYEGFLQGPQAGEQQASPIRCRLPQHLPLRRREVPLGKRQRFRMARALDFDPEFVGESHTAGHMRP